MNWKYVFDTNKKFTGGATFSQALKFVKTTGYQFFTWNGKVYNVTTGNDTGVPVKDLF